MSLDAMSIDEEDRLAIEAILKRQSAAWAAGDAAAFSADTVEDVLFTNIVGMFSVGRGPFEEQHARIFTTIYKGSRMEQELVALTPVREDVAIVDTLARVTDAPGHPPGVQTIEGALRTRLEQVMVKHNGTWRVASFHNVAVHPVAMEATPAAERSSAPR
jgi:uncharacterized protein (TIGR02246 family)